MVSLGARFESTRVRDTIPGSMFDADGDDVGAMVLQIGRGSKDPAGEEPLPLPSAPLNTRDRLLETRKICCR